MGKYIHNKFNDYVKSLNKDLNWSAIPKDDITKSEYPNGYVKKEIGIGNANPMAKFKNWNGKYWRKKQDKDKKGEPQNPNQP